MIKDYHIHPKIIQDAENFREFAKVAIESGVEEICITDHMPLIGNSAGDRIYHGKVSEYCQKVREIREEYQGRLSVRCGIEIDYHPSVCREIEAVLKAGEFDFVLGSSHLHLFREVQTAKTRNDYARAMFENTVSAAKSGYFSAIAHMDMHRWVFRKPDRFPLVDDGYEEKKHGEGIERALEAIREHRLLLEINPHLAVVANCPDEVYPAPSIVAMALDRGIRFCYGSDAHKPEELGSLLSWIRNHAVYGKALKTWEED